MLKNFVQQIAANHHFIRGGWDDPNCAHYSTNPALSAPRRALSRARASYCPLCNITRHLLGSRRTVLHCAHRTSTVSSCAFCEQEGWSGDSLSSLLKPRVARAPGLSQLPRLLFQQPVKTSQLGRSRAETRVRRLSAHSALCSHHSTRQTTRFAPDLESAWLRSLALHSPRVCA
jgi:hypothetical protein